MKYLVLVLVTVILGSCNTREARDKALRDLDNTQHTLLAVRNEINNSEKLLTQTITELEVAKDDMNQVKQFKLLRTEAEREQQIRNATERRLTIERNIDIIKSNIEILKDSVFRTEMQIATLQEYLRN